MYWSDAATRLRANRHTPVRATESLLPPMCRRNSFFSQNGFSLFPATTGEIKQFRAMISAALHVPRSKTLASP